MSTESISELQGVYSRRFHEASAYRQRVWRILVDEFFQQFVPESGVVLDLGCGYGEFINQIKASQKIALDLNPDTRARLSPGIRFLQHDCSQRWPVEDGALDVVFTSNFFEHLADKDALGRALDEIFRTLKPGRRLIAMGPNIKFTGGAYWDFWDHHIALTEASLTEALGVRGFEIERCEARFLPYTMSHGRHYPLWILRVYLRVTWMWRVAGRQFLVIARKPLQP